MSIEPRGPIALSQRVADQQQFLAAAQQNPSQAGDLTINDNLQNMQSPLGNQTGVSSPTSKGAAASPSKPQQQDNPNKILISILEDLEKRVSALEARGKQELPQGHQGQTSTGLRFSINHGNSKLQ